MRIYTYVRVVTLKNVNYSRLGSVTSVIRRKSSFRRARRFVARRKSGFARAVSIIIERAHERPQSDRTRLFTHIWLAGARQNMRVRIPSYKLYSSVRSGVAVLTSGKMTLSKIKGI